MRNWIVFAAAEGLLVATHLYGTAVFAGVVAIVALVWNRTRV